MHSSAEQLQRMNASECEYNKVEARRSLNVNHRRSYEVKLELFGNWNVGLEGIVYFCVPIPLHMCHNSQTIVWTFSILRERDCSSCQPNRALSKTDISQEPNQSDVRQHLAQDNTAQMHEHVRSFGKVIKAASKLNMWCLNWKEMLYRYFRRYRFRN